MIPGQIAPRVSSNGRELSAIDIAVNDAGKDG